MHETRPFNNPFSGATLERRSEARVAADWLEVARADQRCRFIIGRGALQLVRSGPNPGIAYQTASHPWVRNADPTGCSLLGWYEGACHVLVDTRDDGLPLPANTLFSELRPLLSVVEEGEARLLLCARALSVWRVRHRFCGVCGAATTPRNAGHSMRCSNADCNADCFPRLDPAVIMLVHDGDHVLLGRQAGWPPGRYSTLAGFVEVGESLEDAVIREVREETGVRVEAAHYFASQPWPFPSSLMLGYHATARRGAINLDGELEDARWFSSGEIESREALLLPPPHTIARQLIGHWFRSVTGRELNEHG
jgi:NAD+ diphosphatase